MNAATMCGQVEVLVETLAPWFCVGCPAVVKLDDPYFDGRCGTYCRVCIKQHVKACDICARKFPEAVTPRFGCPACHSEDVSENNIVKVRLRVSEWNDDGEPADFRYPWNEIDDTIRTVEENEGARYHCNECDNEFDQPERINKEGPR